MLKRTKGDITKEGVVTAALQLFSVKGYFNTSINDILQATGLTKGGLYCHFESKADLWCAVYEEAVQIWRNITFNDTADITDPLARIEKVCRNVMLNYLGGDVFKGGCFFVNMLVELTGQSPSMSRQILKGFVQFSKLLQIWLSEAERKRLLKPDLNLREIADYIIISLNGAATLYITTSDKRICEHTLSQLRFYIQQLKKE
jgi:AcrR family transcriptional regulator